MARGLLGLMEGLLIMGASDSRGRRTLKTLRAAATLPWSFLMLPGWPAERNIAAYCIVARSLSLPSDLSTRPWMPCV